MSFCTWHNYGYGIRTDNLKIKSVESLEELVHLAPELEKQIKEYFYDCEISTPKIKDYLEFDEDFHNNLASLMRMVIEETEKINLTSCDDFEGYDYLLYQPCYPWQMSEVDRQLNQEKLDELFKRCFSIVTEDCIKLDYLEPENGG